MEQTSVQSTSAKTRAQDKTLELIRSELNLEQWSIWQPTNSHSAPKAKTLTRAVDLPDGTPAVARVEVGFTNKGMLTTEDQKTLYALIKQWEERGRSSTPTSFSLKRLARLLKKQWGTQTVEGLINSLSRLRTTPFTWTNSYYDSATDETVEVLDMFTILADMRVAKRSKAGVITREAGYFKFHDLVLSNLQNNHTKPVLYEVAISFRSEIAQLLYSRLDRMLFDKTQYERRTKELFEDLGLEGKAYKNLSDRKRTLERAFKELVGKPLTSGSITSAKLATTADGKDYKAVFRKGSRAAAAALVAPPAEKGEQAVQSATAPPAKEQPDLPALGAELVKYFYQLFHASGKARINSKAIDQAVSLIAPHGFEQAKYIVEFAHRTAPETNFQIQTFGGVLNYEARALAEYEEAQRRVQQRTARQAEEGERLRLEEAHETYCRQAVDAYLAEHSNELPAWLAEKKKVLLKERPNFYSLWPEEGFTDYALRMVRGEIARKLGLPDFGEYYEQHRSREGN